MSVETTSNGTSGELSVGQRMVEEVEIPVPWGIVAGKWWGSRLKQPVLAIHGWQDNAGSFDRLCPLLPAEISILAIDLPTGDCIDKFLHYETLPESKMPCYGYEEMIDLVLAAYEGSVDHESVEVLMRRGMAPHMHKNGYHFARDLRLKVALMGMFSIEQVLAYAECIKCKVLNIRGKPGMNFGKPEVYEKVMEVLHRTASKVVYYEISGTHHLHLVTPERISNEVSQFLLEE
ncbi:probable serine hydrolase [Anopheles cruzii]|uniref:probable serine hydrolase n=1 Tax=Anopheles cruzii TaxID=68878 RepID=UPI0022EC6FCE|nr:probable serine hydrolase [Anopheles cruzii]